MKTRMVKLIDKNKSLIAVAQVSDEGAHFGGTIDLSATPAPVRALFEEFEELVNDQVLSLLDEIQAKIGTLSIKAVFDDGAEAAVKDLQVYPSTGDVSFKVVGAQALAQKTA